MMRRGFWWLFVCCVLGGLGWLFWESLQPDHATLTFVWGGKTFKESALWVGAGALFCVLLLLAVTISLMRLVFQWRARRLQGLLDLIFRAILNLLGNDDVAFQTILKKGHRWIPDPWFSLGNLFKKDLTSDQETTFLKKLRDFPQAFSFVQQRKISQSLEAQDFDKAWLLMIQAFEGGDQDPWFLKRFWEQALKRQDLGWMTKLLHLFQKSHLPSHEVDHVEAKVLLLKALQVADEDPLFQESLLRQAHDLAPEDGDVGQALWDLLIRQEKHGAAETLCKDLWSRNPRISLIRCVLSDRKEGHFQHVQAITNACSDPLSVLVRGYVAVYGELWEIARTCLQDLEGQDPLGELFLEIVLSKQEKRLLRRVISLSPELTEMAKYLPLDLNAR